MRAKELKVPRLEPQPDLLQCLAIEQGRLARWTFGKPTDCVFYVITLGPPKED